MDKINTHGYISISIFLIALGIGDYTILKESVMLGVFYASVVVLGFMSISFTYCTKCTIRSNCKHFFPGLISQVVKYKNRAYTKADIVVAIIPVVLMIVLPQYWLYRKNMYFNIFWMLVIIASIEVMFFVCKTCGNKKCAMCKNKE